MDIQILIDMLFALLAIIVSVMMRRVFQLFDRLQDEDRRLAFLISEMGSRFVTRNEITHDIDRVLDRIDKLEEKITLNRRITD